MGKERGSGMKRIINIFIDVLNCCSQSNRERNKQHTFGTRFRTKTLLPTPYSLLPILFLLSCTTAPKHQDQPPFESGIMPLDKGAVAYVLIDVAGSRPIIDKLSYIPMADKRMQQIIDKTQTAVMAVFMPSSEETRRFQLLSWGDYPASGSSLVFGANKEWIKLRSSLTTPSYWYSEKAQMSVVVKSKQAYVLASMIRFPRTPIPASEGIKIPNGFSEFGKNAALSCWLSEPAPILRQKLNEMGIPLEIPAEQLFISLFPQGDQKYEAQVKISFQHNGQARIVTNLLYIARRNYVPPVKDANSSSDQNNAAMMSSLLFANPVVQDGNSLFLKSPPLSVDDIALLFSAFSL